MQQDPDDFENEYGPPDYGDDGASDHAARGSTDARPLAAFARRRALAVESLLLTTLKRKLDRLDEPSDSDRVPEGSVSGEPGSPQAPRDPGIVFARLLERSLEQRQDTAERDLLLRTVDQLTCDEARLIAALSDGQSAVACHINAGPRIGLSSVRVLSNATRLGTEAGVMLTDEVPGYITHLLSLGLLDTGPEDREQSERYDMLASDATVRNCVRHIEDTLKMRVSIVRFTLHLSALGRRLWAASDGARQ